MQVETFECGETAAEPVDASAEAIGIIERLGLTGQQSLVCPAKTEGQKTRLPYREMLADEVMVYQTLCPTECRLKDYKASPIPLRVLQLAAHFSELMPDSFLFVWDRAEVAITDPVLIAQTHEYMWSTGAKRFILARWGEVLEPFAVLLKRAIAARRDSLIQQANQVRVLIEGATDAEIVAKSATVSW